VQLGQRVAPGNVLMTVAPLEGVWVDANFKENQLAHLRPGQPVTLEADAYGGSVEFHGHVTGFSPVRAARSRCLPPQNASGNWIKVVQRVPVRIALDPKELDAHPLQIGLSMKVDVRHARPLGRAPAARRAQGALAANQRVRLGRPAGLTPASSRSSSRTATAAPGAARGASARH